MYLPVKIGSSFEAYLIEIIFAISSSLFSQLSEMHGLASWNHPYHHPTYYLNFGHPNYYEKIIKKFMIFHSKEDCDISILNVIKEAIVVLFFLETTSSRRRSYHSQYLLCTAKVPVASEYRHHFHRYHAQTVIRRIEGEPHKNTIVLSAN